MGNCPGFWFFGKEVKDSWARWIGSLEVLQLFGCDGFVFHHFREDLSNLYCCVSVNGFL